ncbi:MAG: hypothetical protein ABI321_22915 [Polyangia bacterium]
MFIHQARISRGARPFIRWALLVGGLCVCIGSAQAKTIYVGPHGNPIAALPAGSSKRLVIGVMGGAGAHVREGLGRDIRAMGAEIAKAGHITLTGACQGLPHEAIIGAKTAGGLTAGISGHANKRDHVAHGAPTDHLDVIQFTSLPFAQRGQIRPNYMGREIDNIERSNALLFVGGRSGTLGEFAIAYEEGRPIGVLKGSGGVSGEFAHLVKVMTKEGKPPRAPIVFDRDPRRLVRKVLKATEKHKPDAVKWEG